MKKKVLVLFFFLLATCIVPALFATSAFATNPFITDFYTADPSAHVFNNRVYVYPTHDNDDQTWFDMTDYHVYSSSDMVKWVDHGIVFNINQVGWAKKWLWASDCVYKDGMYYLYFAASTKTYQQSNKDKKGGPDDFRIGVAYSSSPTGPFTTGRDYIAGTNSVSPCVFVDTDGQAYLFFGGDGHGGLKYPKWAKLKSNMTQLAENAKDINPAPQNWNEATWVHKRNGLYYLSYATTSEGQGARIEYATSERIYGPWIYRGVILNSVTKATQQHSIVEFPSGSDNWYIFYHNEELSGGVYYKRSICVDRLYYNNNGTIKTVVPTRTGIGTDAYTRIKATLYNSMSGVQKEDVSGDIGQNVAYINNGDWTTYEGIVFDNDNSAPQTFAVSVASPNNGGLIEIRLGDAKGTLIGQVDVPNTGGWQNWTKITSRLNTTLNGTQKITLVYKGKGEYLFNVNWFKFFKADDIVPRIPSEIEVSFRSAYNGKLVSALLNKSGVPLFADRDVLGSWEKFEILRAPSTAVYVGVRSFANRHYWQGMYPLTCLSGSLQRWKWISNDDGTVTFHLNKDSYDHYVTVEEGSYQLTHGYNPNTLRAKFYVEAHDAPIGCVVALKSYQFNSYVTNRSDEICLGDSGINSDKDRFLVVDAGSGYIAFKSLSNNQFLRSQSSGETLKANGGTTVDSDRERFLWVDNLDGTISLKCVSQNQFLCADNDKGKNPIKIYANRDKIGEWEKFYCHIQ